MNVFEVYFADYDEHSTLGLFATRELAELAASSYRKCEKKQDSSIFNCGNSSKSRIFIREHKLQTTFDIKNKFKSYNIQFEGDKVYVSENDPWLEKDLNKISIRKIYPVSDDKPEYCVDLCAKSKKEARTKALEAIKEYKK